MSCFVLRRPTPGIFVFHLSGSLHVFHVCFCVPGLGFFPLTGLARPFLGLLGSSGPSLSSFLLRMYSVADLVHCQHAIIPSNFFLCYPCRFSTGLVCLHLTRFFFFLVVVAGFFFWPGASAVQNSARGAELRVRSLAPWSFDIVSPWSSLRIFDTFFFPTRALFSRPGIISGPS